MSLVGPRPEIPVFVEHFKEIVPLYMIKHYVKPGITGLAQIKGFRGDTSIEARIHEDIEYIEHWSLALDLYVLLKTPFKALNKNEKYVDPSKDGEEGSDDGHEVAFIPTESDAVPVPVEIPEEPKAPEVIDEPAPAGDNDGENMPENNEKETGNE